MFKASVFWMNESRIHRNMKTLVMTAPQNSAAVTDVTFHSTYRKGYQSKLLFFHSKGSRCSFWVLLSCDDMVRTGLEYSLKNC